MGGITILEHTADVGLRASGDDLLDLFATATRGMAEIAGVLVEHGDESVPIAVPDGDLGGILVDWLDEVLFAYDSRTAGVAWVEVAEVDAAAGARGRVVLGPLPPEERGTQIKAVTYHQLKVAPKDSGWEATVFFDV